MRFPPFPYAVTAVTPGNCLLDRHTVAFACCPGMGQGALVSEDPLALCAPCYRVVLVSSSLRRRVAARRSMP
ncbi:MAG TPA: hypothetical protein PKC73_12650, partial [Dermatophilaceae bacterium]|nr:hypothetical protein [Dermatophilaceae bacterium]